MRFPLACLPQVPDRLPARSLHRVWSLEGSPVVSPRSNVADGDPSVAACYWPHEEYTMSGATGGLQGCHRRWREQRVMLRRRCRKHSPRACPSQVSLLMVTVLSAGAPWVARQQAEPSAHPA